MNFLLLADFEKLVVFVVVIAIYLIASLVKYAGERRPAPARRPAPPPAPRAPQGDPADRAAPPRLPPAAAGPAPQRELDRFLEELGVRQPHPPPPRPAPPQPRPSRRERQRPKQAAAPAETVRASQRHLTSRLESRRADDVRSEIEAKRLETHVHGVESRIGESEDASAPSRRKRDDILLNLIRNRDTLARAMVLGMVLGPPNALQDRPPLV